MKWSRWLLQVLEVVERFTGDPGEYVMLRHAYLIGNRLNRQVEHIEVVS